MTKGELVEILRGIQDDVPVVLYRDDFPRDVERFELIKVRRYEDHYHEEFYPTSDEDAADYHEGPVQTVLVLRERKGAKP